YEIDIFGNDFHRDSADLILCAHTHVVSTSSDANLEAALHRAMDEILGSEAEELKLRVGRRRTSWALMSNVESIVLGLKEYLPSQAEEILTRARRQNAGVPMVES